MSRPVKKRRTYDSSRRQAQARQTRRAVLDAARARFLERGYAATTMSDVAADAAVSLQTVYKAFTNKPGLVKAVFDVAVVGDDEPIPMLQREFVARTQAEPDPREKLRGYGAHMAEVAPRAFPVQFIVREAAATDTGAAEVWETLQTERLVGMTAFATDLDAGGHLRAGISIEHARDVLWVHNSVELWDLLVNQRDWSTERYGEWIGQQLIAALLGP
jgi:AcrR family transcriptional regulator